MLITGKVARTTIVQLGVLIKTIKKADDGIMLERGRPLSGATSVLELKSALCSSVAATATVATAPSVRQCQFRRHACWFTTPVSVLTLGIQTLPQISISGKEKVDSVIRLFPRDTIVHSIILF